MGENEEAAPKAPNWSLVWTIGAFLVGVLFSAGMGWGRSSSSLDNMANQIARLEGTVSVLADKYANSDKTNSNAIERADIHLTYNDQRLDKDEQRLDKLEAGQRK